MGLNDKQIQSKWCMKSDVFTMTVKFSMKGQRNIYSFHIYMMMIFREYILYMCILLTWLLTRKADYSWVLSSPRVTHWWQSDELLCTEFIQHQIF